MNDQIKFIIIYQGITWLNFTIDIKKPKMAFLSFLNLDQLMHALGLARGISILHHLEEISDVPP